MKDISAYYGKTGMKKGTIRLRGIAAFTVLMWHYSWILQQYNYPWVNPHMIFRGDIANVFFFYTSGYFAGIKTKQKVRLENTMTYVLHKLRRIYPLWAFTTLFSGLLSCIYDKENAGLALSINGFPFRRFIMHLLLIQSWFPYIDAGSEFNGPGWFLSVLYFFWLLTPAFLGLLSKIESKFRISMRLVFFVFVLLYVMYLLLWMKRDMNLNGIFQPWTFLSYFLGVFSGRYGRKASECNNGFWSNRVFLWMLLCLMIVLSNIFFGNPLLFCLYSLYFYWIVPKCDAVPEKDTLLTRIEGELGMISMELYLIHVPLMKAWFILLNYGIIKVSYWGSWILLSVLAIGGAFFLNSLRNKAQPQYHTVRF